MHVREQIRDAYVNALTGNTSVGANVFPSRIYPIQATIQSCLLIFSNDERVDRATIGSKTLMRELSVTIEAYVKNNVQVDNALDAIAVDVENTIQLDPTLGGLVLDTTFDSMTLRFEQGDKPVGVMTLNFTSRYRTSLSDAETFLD